MPAERAAHPIAVLEMFAEHPGRVLSRDFLLGQARGRQDVRSIESVCGAGHVPVPEFTVR
jgi:DNA-binding response OmpR family regulator